MPKWQFTKGLHDLGNGGYAWLQPDGGWGYSNSGLIVDQGENLLVDTLFDLAHTREMLDAFRASVPAAKRIGTLVNTHSNGDHTFGNQLVSGARILASRACAEEMAQHRPEHRAEMARRWREFGNAGAAAHELYDGKFDFEGIVYTPPTETFDRGLTLHVGAKDTAPRSRPRTYTRRCAGPRTAGPRGLHRRYRVQRRAPPRLGRPDLELDQSLRRNPQLGRRDNRPGTWTDHRQARRPRDETLLRIRHYRDAQAFRFLA